MTAKITAAMRAAAYQALVKRGVPIPPNEIDAVLEAAEGARGTHGTLEQRKARLAEMTEAIRERSPQSERKGLVERLRHAANEDIYTVDVVDRDKVSDLLLAAIDLLESDARPAPMADATDVEAAWHALGGQLSGCTIAEVETALTAAAAVRFKRVASTDTAALEASLRALAGHHIDYTGKAHDSFTNVVDKLLEAADFIRDSNRPAPMPEEVKAALDYLRDLWPTHAAIIVAHIDDLTRKVADYEEQAADHRRNVRLIDVAMHGEAGAAKQASTCDLIDPARLLRERAETAERDRDTWKNSAIRAQSRVNAVVTDLSRPQVTDAVLADAIALLAKAQGKANIENWRDDVFSARQLLASVRPKAEGV